MTLPPVRTDHSAVATNILRQAAELVSHSNELARTTGARFNLFQILKIGHYEVATHSPILAELLDPNGSHAQGPVFLELFLGADTISHRQGSEWRFDTSTAVVHCEYGIGVKTDSAGGRIDILITDGRGRRIAIENKINAVEQDNWVERYLDFLGPDGLLIYLTLDGVAPQEVHERACADDLIQLSYASHITRWLKDCRKEAATVPVVRESITQYLHLIERLTNQNPDTHMTENLAAAVLNDTATFDAYCVLRDCNQMIRSTVIRRLGNRIRDRVPVGFEVIATPTGSGQKYDGFTFTTDALRRENLMAVISFDAFDYGSCIHRVFVAE